MSSNTDGAAPNDGEAEMLPDERQVIAEREPDLDEMDDEDFLTVEELGEKLGFE